PREERRMSTALDDLAKALGMTEAEILAAGDRIFNDLHRADNPFDALMPNGKPLVEATPEALRRFHALCAYGEHYRERQRAKYLARHPAPTEPAEPDPAEPSDPRVAEILDQLRQAGKFKNNE